MAILYTYKIHGHEATHGRAENNGDLTELKNDQKSVQTF